MPEYPLISVLIATFRSSRYIRETLDSIRDQDYPRIDLVVSDDCSPDDTIAVCREWFSENGSRFEHWSLVESPENYGTCANFNRGLAACRGEWIKLLGGDDLLVPQALSRFSVATTISDNRFFLCNRRSFGSEEKVLKIAASFAEKDSAGQLNYLLTHMNEASGTAMFLHLKTLQKLGGFDERFKLLEDFPLALRVCDCGYRWECIPDELVRYRIHEQSVTQIKSNSLFYQSYSLFYHAGLIPLLLKHGYRFRALRWRLYLLLSDFVELHKIHFPPLIRLKNFLQPNRRNDRQGS